MRLVTYDRDGQTRLGAVRSTSANAWELVDLCDGDPALPPTIKHLLEAGDSALDRAAAGVQKGLRVMLDRRVIQGPKGRLDELKKLLKPGGRGEVKLVVELDDRGRVLELALPGKFDVSPTQRGLISTVPGVIEVVDI